MHTKCCLYVYIANIPPNTTFWPRSATKIGLRYPIYIMLFWQFFVLHRLQFKQNNTPIHSTLTVPSPCLAHSLRSISFCHSLPLFLLFSYPVLLFTCPPLSSISYYFCFSFFTLLHFLTYLCLPSLILSPCLPVYLSLSFFAFCTLLFSPFFLEKVGWI